MAVTEYSIWLPPDAATPSDGSANNAAAAIKRYKGTEADPKKHGVVAQLDPNTNQYLTFKYKLPPGTVLGAGITAKLNIDWSSITAITATAVVFAARVGKTTPGDVDTPVEHALAAAQSVTDSNDTVEAGRLNTAQITFTNAQLDALVAGDLIHLLFYRDAANGADSLAEACYVWGLQLVLSPLA